MNIRFLGISFDRGAKHLRRTLIVLHLVQCFAGHHVGLGGVRIQIQNLAIHLQHALVLLGPEAAVRQRQPQGQILRVVRRGHLQKRHSIPVFGQPVVGHPDQRVQLLIVWLRLQQDAELLNRFLQIAALEQRQSKIQPQPGHVRAQLQRLAIKWRSFFVVLLTGFKQSKVRIGLRARRVILQIRAPCILSLGIVPLLFQRQSLLTARIWRSPDLGPI